MILNQNQRTVAQLLILGKTTEEIMEKTELTRQTVNRIKRELEEVFQNLFKYENELDNKFKEVSEIESDIEIIKNVFLKRDSHEIQ